MARRTMETCVVCRAEFLRTPSAVRGTPQTLEEWEAKAIELATLLVECRDALPAITLASARLRNIRLDLADRIEEALKPWEV